MKNTDKCTELSVYIHPEEKPITVVLYNNPRYFGDSHMCLYDDFKISLVLSDDCGAVIGDKVYFPKRGDLVIFRPDELHFGRFPRPVEYRFISILIPIDLFDHVFTESKSILDPFLDNSEERINHICLTDDYKKQMIECAEEIFKLSVEYTSEKYAEIKIMSKIIEILDILNIFYPLQKALPTVSSVPPLISRTIKKINENFPEHIKLEELADHCGCSVTYLTQTFKRYTGKSIYQYLTELRLEYAQRMLKAGESVTEVCYKSGFTDCSGFISLFKRHFGITPGKYMRK